MFNIREKFSIMYSYTTLTVPEHVSVHDVIYITVQ